MNETDFIDYVSELRCKQTEGLWAHALVLMLGLEMSTHPPPYQAAGVMVRSGAAAEVVFVPVR